MKEKLKNWIILIQTLTLLGYIIYVPSIQHRNKIDAETTEGPEKPQTMNLSLSPIDPTWPAQYRHIQRSRYENTRNYAVDRFIELKEIAIPDGNYLLIANQPWGIVTSLVLINLDEKTALGINTETSTETISRVDAEFLIELLSSDLMQTFPASSGKAGFDGRSIVVYFKCGTNERAISHWSPESIGIRLFETILNRYTGKVKVL
ncbi:hypothetical protein [Coraliomargarita parva]|uniref:hypothetical protein n=1 Tax=Coraliomargarita parva TaxID=3014050 RepID=UPI0022B468B6|nr:hypothetical protein [Coraliomargarita parva]